MEIRGGDPAMWLNLWRKVKDLHVHPMLRRHAAQRVGEGKVDDRRWRDRDLKEKETKASEK